MDPRSNSIVDMGELQRYVCQLKQRVYIIISFGGGEMMKIFLMNFSHATFILCCYNTTSSDLFPIPPSIPPPFFYCVPSDIFFNLHVMNLMVYPNIHQINSNQITNECVVAGRATNPFDCSNFNRSGHLGRNRHFELKFLFIWYVFIGIKKSLFYYFICIRIC